MRRRGAGTRNFDGMSRRVASTKLPMSMFQDDINGRRQSRTDGQTSWSPRVGLERDLCVDQVPSPTEFPLILEFTTMLGDPAIIVVGDSGIEGFVCFPDAASGGNPAPPGDVICDMEDDTLWTVAGPSGNPSKGAELGFFNEGAASLFVTVDGTYIGNDVIEVEKAGLGPWDISGYTSIQVMVGLQSLESVTVGLEVEDTVAGAQIHPTPVGLSGIGFPVWLPATFAISAFAIVALQSVIRVTLRVSWSVGGAQTNYFDIMTVVP